MQHPDHLSLGVVLKSVSKGVHLGDGVVSRSESKENSMESFLGDRLGFPKSYTRDEHELGWVTKDYGDDLTGYDLVASIEAFMKSQRAENLSIAEFIHAESSRNPKAKVPAVRRAVVFVSHIQKASPFDVWDLPNGYGLFRFNHDEKNKNKMERCLRQDQDHNMEEHIFYTDMLTYPVWIDYFCLRQCVDDFELPKILQLIGNIGFTLVLLPCKDVTEYLSRSFCVFEMFATIQSKGELFVRCAETISGEVQSISVDVKTATSRYGEDMIKINSYIDTIGADVVNGAVEKAVVNGARATYEGRLVGTVAAAAFLFSLLELNLFKHKLPSFHNISEDHL